MESLLQLAPSTTTAASRRALRHRGRRAGPADHAVHDLPDAAAIRRCSWTSARSGSRGRSRTWRRSSASRSSTRAPTGYKKGLVDGDNSGSAAFDWAARPGATVKQIMERVSMPLADPVYFPGGGNWSRSSRRAASRASPARWPTAAVSGLFSLVWDEAADRRGAGRAGQGHVQPDQRRPGRTRSSCRNTRPCWNTSNIRRPTIST